MYRIGELAKMAEVTPDTIRYYEKQQMMAVSYTHLTLPTTERV